jgi:hypothetical protein
MALEGSIKEFGLADILQLVHLQSKTGELILTGEHGQARLVFHNGSLVWAESPGFLGPDRIVEALVQAERIKPSDLKRLESHLKKRPDAAHEILVEMDLLDKAEVARIRQFLISEAAMQLFRWTEGRYAFDQKETAGPPADVTPINTEFLLMESMRRQDEWPEIKRTIQSLQAVFERTAEAPNPTPAETQTEDPFNDLNLEESETTERAAQILSSVDGVRTVEKIIALSLKGEFETCQALSQLIKAGKIKLRIGAESDKAGKIADQKKRRSFSAQTAVKIAANVGFTVITVAVIAAVTQSVSVDRLRRSAVVGEFIKETNLRNQILQLEKYLEWYRLSQGEYPEQLDRIGSEYPRLSEIVHPLRNHIRYRRDGDGYQLETVSPQAEAEPE